ncbi:hypothetical protein ACM16X_02265 [Haloarcula japonica]|uniref:hypothetical protein n=1 Tax=Haloarcula japonica TaxID=29282 RepID=UPI0039F6D383
MDERLSPAFKLSTTNWNVPVIIQFDYSDTEVLDSMQVFNGPVVVVLVGEAVPQKGEYDQREITCVTLSDILEGELNYTSLCKSAFQNKVPPKILAKTGIDLYKNNRSRYSWREFEHTVQHCFSAIFETSRLLGGEESGEQVPEGVLSLDYGEDSHAYIWDAKYVKEPDTSRSLSGEYENMSKHLVDFRKESNVKKIYDDVSGFLIVSPKVSGSSIVRLAERIQRRLAQNSDSWNGAVTHLRFESLIQLFEDVQSNRDDVQSKPLELRRHVHRLFTQSNYHEGDPEEYSQSDQRVFEVSIEDINLIFNKYITHQEPNSDRINIDGYLANIRSLDI